MGSKTSEVFATLAPGASAGEHPMGFGCFHDGEDSRSDFRSRVSHIPTNLTFDLELERAGNCIQAAVGLNRFKMSRMTNKIIPKTIIQLPPV
jgi:hypothetical protein